MGRISTRSCCCRRGFRLDDRAAARCAASRARARPPLRLPNAAHRADRLRGSLVQSAGVDRGATAPSRARACLRRRSAARRREGVGLRGLSAARRAHRCTRSAPPRSVASQWRDLHRWRAACSPCWTTGAGVAGCQRVPLFERTLSFDAGYCDALRPSRPCRRQRATLRSPAAAPRIPGVVATTVSPERAVAPVAPIATLATVAPVAPVALDAPTPITLSSRPCGSAVCCHCRLELARRRGRARDYGRECRAALPAAPPAPCDRDARGGKRRSHTNWTSSDNGSKRWRVSGPKATARTRSKRAARSSSTATSPTSSRSRAAGRSRSSSTSATTRKRLVIRPRGDGTLERTYFGQRRAARVRCGGAGLVRRGARRARSADGVRGRTNACRRFSSAAASTACCRRSRCSAATTRGGGTTRSCCRCGSSIGAQVRRVVEQAGTRYVVRLRACGATRGVVEARRVRRRFAHRVRGGGEEDRFRLRAPPRAERAAAAGSARASHRASAARCGKHDRVRLRAGRAADRRLEALRDERSDASGVHQGGRLHQVGLRASARSRRDRCRGRPNAGGEPGAARGRPVESAPTTSWRSS